MSKKKNQPNVITILIWSVIGIISIANWEIISEIFPKHPEHMQASMMPTVTISQPTSLPDEIPEGKQLAPKFRNDEKFLYQELPVSVTDVDLYFENGKFRGKVTVEMEDESVYDLIQRIKAQFVPDK